MYDFLVAFLHPGQRDRSAGFAPMHFCVLHPATPHAWQRTWVPLFAPHCGQGILVDQFFTCRAPAVRGCRTRRDVLMHLAARMM